MATEVKHLIGVSGFNQLDHVETMARVYPILVCYCNLQFAHKCNERYKTQGHHGLTDGQTKEYRDVNDLSGHAIIHWSNHLHDY